ncbi:DUF3231 family protein [Bacillus sp. CGMCC 1.16541]|uniref:DUF3231 family protein n=1 Tax=Bacillus sp. CGMCC 1.16541 TaxID=2185143 RepID=UPI000D73FCAF|nr:DUF3231 family protein [Bacillus sp. CGMCC 1.16541]
MTAHESIRLTSAEMTALWSNYINDSLGKCVLTYFLQHVEDEDVKPIIEYALELSNEHLHAITTIFKSENFPLPKGFTDDDINVKAPRLYSDMFYLQYLRGMSTMGLTTYSASLSLMARTDIVSYLNQCVSSSMELMNKTREVLLQKGVYIRPPYMSYPKKVTFVHNKSFYGGLLKSKRTLTGIEITHLFLNAENNALGRALLTGFAQVAKSKRMREYFYRGTDISRKHIDVFSKLLLDSHLPAPMTWDSDVMNSKVAPFSDKLMLFHTTALNAAGTGNYGLATAASPRADIATTYARLQLEIGSYAKDGADMMIEKGWMEAPPQADDRKKIAGV